VVTSESALITSNSIELVWPAQQQDHSLTATTIAAFVAVATRVRLEPSFAEKVCLELALAAAIDSGLAA